MNVNSSEFKLIRYIAVVGVAAFTALYSAAFIGAGRNGGALRGISDWVFHWQLLLGAVFVGFLAAALWTRRQLVRQR